MKRFVPSVSLIAVISPLKRETSRLRNACAGVIADDMVTLTEPYAVPTVHIGVTEHARGEVILKTGYPVYHPETVMEGVVMENTAFPSHNPQRVLRVGVEPVQIDLRATFRLPSRTV